MAIRFYIVKEFDRHGEVDTHFVRAISKKQAREAVIASRFPAGQIRVASQKDLNEAIASGMITAGTRKGDDGGDQESL